MASFTVTSLYTATGENIDFHYDEEMSDVLSNEGKTIFDYVNYVVVCGLVSLFGIAANIINVVIFCKQGFNNTANIAFIGLAISDLCCLIALEMVSFFMNPLITASDINFVSVEIMYLSSGWPHVCFGRITCFITVYITAERFLSIALPLKIKDIVTARRTIIIMCLIYTLNVATFIPEYATSYLGWIFVPNRNRTLVGIIYRSSRQDVEGICYMVHTLLSATSFVAVIVLTFALVFKLRQTTEWRKEASSVYNQLTAQSNRERKTVKMVVLIASVLIICYIPGAVICTVTFILGSDFNIQGKYFNTCLAMWSIACCCQSINSSVNIFLYYRMSSKYRHTFQIIFLKLFSFAGTYRSQV